MSFRPQLFSDREWLKNEYETNLRTASDIARQFAATPSSIFYWLKKHGIIVRPGRKLPENEIIIADYRSGMSAAKIGVKYGASVGAVISLLHRINEPMRNTSELSEIKKSRHEHGPTFKDLTGMKFGRWRVIKFEPHAKGYASKFLCQCDCGVVRPVLSSALTDGVSKSCGCLTVESVRIRATKHGMHLSKEYEVWRNMKRRCLNPKSKEFKHYGGRGIKVCDKWLKFIGFISDMGKIPSPGLTIDRINNDGNYEPGNCKWATRSEQNCNKRSKERIQLDSQRKALN